jgi:hypothetical protein
MSTDKPKRPENLLLNLVCNIAIPTLILMKFSSDKWLGPVWGLIAGLAFPFGYGVWDFIQRKETNLFSIVGFVSVLLSGGLGLLKVGGVWFAIKDAAIPLVMATAVILSLRSKHPLVRTVLLNDQVIDVTRVETALDERGQKPAFDALLVRASWGLAGALALTAVLHFFVVLYVLRSPPGTEAFNKELGRVMSLSLLVVALPSVAAFMLILWRVVKGLENLTGLDSDAIFHTEPKAEKK